MHRIVPALILAAILGVLAWRAQPDGHLTITFPAVKGDAALIRTPDGRTILVDGGADPAALTAALGRWLPFWQRSLDLVVVTSADSQRLPGQVAALARYRAERVLAGPLPARGANITEWRRLLAEQGTRLQTAAPGTQIRYGAVRLTVLAAGDGDDAGLALRIDYGATSVLLANSAAPKDTDAILSRDSRPVHLLITPWQRDPRNPLVQTLAPQHILFSDGHRDDNPPELTLPERAIGGATVYHEKLNGTITWRSDGRRVVVDASTVMP